MLSYATVEFHVFYDGICKYEPFLQVVRVESDTQVTVKAVVSSCKKKNGHFYLLSNVFF